MARAGLFAARTLETVDVMVGGAEPKVADSATNRRASGVVDFVARYFGLTGATVVLIPSKAESHRRDHGVSSHDIARHSAI
jgi:hypothetical protein